VEAAREELESERSVEAEKLRLLQQSRELAEMEVDDIRGALVSLRRQSEVEQHEEQRAARAVQTLQEAVAAAKASVAGLSESADGLRRELEAMGRRQGELQTEMAELVKQKRDEEAVFHTLQEQSIGARADEAEKRRIRHTMEQQLAQLQLDAAAGEELVRHIARQKAAVEEQVNHHRAQMTQVEHELARLMDSRDEMRKRCECLVNQTSAAREAIELERRAIKELIEEKMGLEKERTALQAVQDGLQTEVAGLRHLVDQARKGNFEWFTARSSEEAQLREILGVKNDLSHGVRNKESLLAELQQEISSLREQAEQRSGELLLAKAAVVDERARVLALVEQAQSAQSDRAVTMRSIQQHESELAVLQKALMTEREKDSDAVARIVSLEDEHRKLASLQTKTTSEVGRLQDAIVGMRQRAAQLASEREELELTSRQIREELHEKEAMVATSRKQLGELKSRREQYADALNRLRDKRTRVEAEVANLKRDEGAAIEQSRIDAERQLRRQREAERAEAERRCIEVRRCWSVPLQPFPSVVLWQLGIVVGSGALTGVEDCRAQAEGDQARVAAGRTVLLYLQQDAPWPVCRGGSDSLGGHSSRRVRGGREHSPHPCRTARARGALPAGRGVRCCGEQAKSPREHGASLLLFVWLQGTGRRVDLTWSRQDDPQRRRKAVHCGLRGARRVVDDRVPVA
jgi:chromosome segregation ATPase